jgi:hypothetical protein
VISLPRGAVSARVKTITISSTRNFSVFGGLRRTTASRFRTGESIMKKLVRQRSNNASVPDLTLDFGAAAAKVARTFEPNEYKLRVQSAKVIQRNDNVLIALDLLNCIAAVALKAGRYGLMVRIRMPVIWQPRTST